ncbi:MAG TPA: HAD-IIIA family hydrolase [Lachnospiraceae bacterium]|nr:HAD-IIIA family hydrolase [Lachnospiraceae bacterium]HPF29426.1 HAD-IIIA family hydrolase [Lachnospiraceae bacterium]
MECMKYKPIEQAVIFAGGLGERLKPFTLTNPKPMYPFNDKPFIEYLIVQIKEFGISDIILLLGYLPEKIMDYLGDGSRYGVKITYCVTPVEYDTQFRLKSAQNLLQDQFLMMYCDNYCPIDFSRLVSEYYENEAWIQFSAYANEDGYTKNNLKIGEQGIVEIYDKKRKQPDLSGVDIGYAIVSKKVLSLMSENNENFEAVVYPKLVDMQKLYATVTHHRYYSVGSFERIELTKEFLSDKKYVFLDRDGTMNERAPKAQYIKSPEEFVWLPGAKEAIKKLKKAGYFTILISNQAGIARGAMTEEDLAAVHSKMQSELEEAGAGIDAIYYCAHNWEEGCSCRKPKPGMFYMAQKDYSINLTKCVMFGDDDRDMQAAKAAGVRGIQITEEYSLQAAVENYLAKAQ